MLLQCVCVCVSVASRSLATFLMKDDNNNIHDKGLSLKLQQLPQPLH